jgi:Txe/YoeB family toxin of toxin-antitoxin system
MYKLRRAARAKKDMEVAERAGFKSRVADIMGTIVKNPYERSQGFKKLKGLRGETFSRQINDKHRVVYKVLPNSENLKDPQTGKPYKGIVRVISLWTHYEAGRKL